MSALILNSLEIRRFRAFQHLRIEQLGRVNLIVGKNNVGKSSLLEALQIYAQRIYPNLLWQILRTHDEGARPRRSGITYREEEIDYDAALASVRYLFYGREEIKGPTQPIQIGPVDKPGETLSLTIEFYVSKVDNDGLSTIQQLPLEGYEMPAQNVIPCFSLRVGSHPLVNIPITSNITTRSLRRNLKEITCISVDAGGLDKTKIGQLWDQVALTDQEGEVLSALRIISPGIEGITMVADASSSRERIPLVRVVGIKEPLPIRSLGDGMFRMFGIALALINAKDGILLIDEIENGLHYSIQPSLWRFIFQVARNLDVQIFATSHSWDCVEAFQKATQEDQQEEGALIRLESKSGHIRAVVFNEQKLEIATREQIEVR